MPLLSNRIQAGRFRHKVEIVQPTTEQDSSGGYEIDRDTVVAVDRASVEALSGRELYAAQQKVAQVTHKIRLHWRPGIRARQNVRWDVAGGAEYPRFFQIEAVENPDGVRHVLELLCIEREDSMLQGGDTIR